MRCSGGLTIKESATGVEFPLVRTFWEGEAQRNVGASVRQKKIAFLGVKVSLLTRTGDATASGAGRIWSLTS